MTTEQINDWFSVENQKESEYMKDINNIIEKWENIGFLQGITSNIKKQETSLAYEIMGNYYSLLNNGDGVKQFASVRRIINKLNDNLTFEQIILHIKNVVLELDEHLSKELINHRKNPVLPHPYDIEAEIVARYCDEYVKNK